MTEETEKDIKANKSIFLFEIDGIKYGTKVLPSTLSDEWLEAADEQRHKNRNDKHERERERPGQTVEKLLLQNRVCHGGVGSDVHVFFVKRCHADIGCRGSNETDDYEAAGQLVQQHQAVVPELVEPFAEGAKELVGLVCYSLQLRYDGSLVLA